MSTLSLRTGIQGLVVYAERDLSTLLKQASTEAETHAAINDLLPKLIDTYGSAAASLAADWYDNLREERAIKGTFRASPADIANSRTESLIGWASATATSPETFRGFILGGTQRRIANFSRLTVTQSSVADPQARGWARVGDGNSCAFCQMLLDRGAVYTEESADFAAHDRCGCGAEPDFG